MSVSKNKHDFEKGYTNTFLTVFDFNVSRRRRTPSYPISFPTRMNVVSVCSEEKTYPKSRNQMIRSITDSCPIISDIPRSKKQTSGRIKSDKILCLQDFFYDLVIRSDKIVCVRYFQDVIRL